MRFDVSRLVRSLGCFVPRAERIEQGMWIGFAVYAAVMMVAVVGGATTRAAPEVVYDLELMQYACPLYDQRPVFDRDADERTHLTEYLGGFRHLADLEAPLSRPLLPAPQRASLAISRP